MRLFVPPLGTLLALTQDWTFPLYAEDRNNGVRSQLGLIPPGERRFDTYRPRAPQSEPATLPAGTQLRVDRIYIRRGSKGFDSISFLIADCPDPRLRSKRKGGTAENKKLRFWAKLSDVNGIECDIVQEA